MTNEQLQNLTRPGLDQLQQEVLSVHQARDKAELVAALQEGAE